MYLVSASFPSVDIKLDTSLEPTARIPKVETWEWPAYLSVWQVHELIATGAGDDVQVSFEKLVQNPQGPGFLSSIVALPTEIVTHDSKS